MCPSPTAPQHDKWGKPRVPHVYPAKRSLGYYAKGLDANGQRRKPKFFGHKRYNGVDTAYELACQYASGPAPSHHSRTLTLDTATPVAHQTPSEGPRRYRLASRFIDLRQSRSGDGSWVVSVNIGWGSNRRVRHFDVATYGLTLALRNAIKSQLDWEERYRGKTDFVGSDNWVRLFLYILQRHGTTPVSLTDLEPPAEIKLRAQSVQCVRPGGLKRRFHHAAYGGRFRAHVAAIAWAIEDLPIDEISLAA
jgi:hypothetical protein